ncbi:MAG TPA: Crp/Fnr family transcriptional regulator [Pyrinomonadaceae bacterium]|nr:Crp/Fnr family transcriptional regulator [Pyrinomonadaceae bacterium]
MAEKVIPVKNHILAALPRGEYARLRAHLEPVTLAQGEALYKSGDAIQHVYFPEAAVVSLVTHMRDGATIEVALIGRDGMVGIPVLLGDDIAFEAAVVQVAGGALRLETSVLKERLKRSRNPLLVQLLLYTRALMKQVAQTAACNGRHTVEKRLARWLLMCRDRVDSDDLQLTQEFVSDMLGMRRAGVSDAAMRLQEEGFIRLSRDRISIVKREGLEEFVCECYGAVKDDYNRRSADERQTAATHVS